VGDFAHAEGQQVGQHDHPQVLPHRPPQPLRPGAEGGPEQGTLGQRSERLGHAQVEHPVRAGIEEHGQDEDDNGVSAGGEPDASEEAVLEGVTRRQADEEDRRLDEDGKEIADGQEVPQEVGVHRYRARRRKGTSARTCRRATVK
jgi:hypothetical protein